MPVQSNVIARQNGGKGLFLLMLIVENMSNEYSNIQTSLLQNARVRFWMLGVCGGDVR
jgi:hypothetical protein